MKYRIVKRKIYTFNAKKVEVSVAKGFKLSSMAYWTSNKNAASYILEK